MPAVELTEISKSFGRVQALDSLSFSVESGWCVALVGPNGAGKTTAFRILSGQIRQFAGEARINGDDVRKRRKPIGCLVDGPALYPHLSVKQNLEFVGAMLGVPEAKADKSLQELLLQGVEGQDAGTLSHGNKQRVGLAIALTCSRSTLLLDEPLTGLDPELQYEMRKLLQQLTNEGAAILISSHILNDVEAVASEYVFLRQGSAVAQGSHEDFAADRSLVLKVRDSMVAVRVLSDRGYEASARTSVEVVVNGPSIDGESVARVLASHGIHPREMRYEDVPLEEIYLKIMSGESSK